MGQVIMSKAAHEYVFSFVNKSNIHRFFFSSRFISSYSSLNPALGGPSRLWALSPRIVVIINQWLDCELLLLIVWRWLTLRNLVAICEAYCFVRGFMFHGWMAQLSERRLPYYRKLFKLHKLHISTHQRFYRETDVLKVNWRKKKTEKTS